MAKIRQVRWSGGEPVHRTVMWNLKAEKDRKIESKKEEVWKVYWDEVRKFDRQKKLWG